jgi:hypothetical protein
VQEPIEELNNTVHAFIRKPYIQKLCKERRPAMSRLVKRPAHFACVIIAVLTLHGCLFNAIIGPGYCVSIYVNDPDFTHDNLAKLEEIAVQNNFKKIQTVEEPQWYGVYYHSDAREEKTGSTQLMITFHDDEKLLRVEVVDVWTGQRAQVKSEIDRLISIYAQAISTIYGKDNVKIVQNRTGPCI